MSSLLLVAAIALALWWLFQQRGQSPAPSCVRCGFDLRGLESVNTCPECGAAIGPRSRTPRRRTEQYLLLALSACALTLWLALTFGSLLAFQAMRIAPTGVLLSWADPAQRVHFPEAARWELLRRARAGAITSAQAQAWFDESMEIVKSRPADWTQFRADLIQALWESQQLNDAAYTSFIDRCFAMHAAASDGGADAVLLSVSVVPTGLGPSKTLWLTIGAERVLVACGGNSMVIPGEFRQALLSPRAQDVITFQLPRHDLPAGECEVSMRLTLWVESGDAPPRRIEVVHDLSCTLSPANAK